ncbi:MAG: hypothetical protein PHV34_15885 [Verrucomicrobiae bacterium]|nr:hypothetical protein [Verrucomicrobiae bacterium]
MIKNIFHILFFCLASFASFPWTTKADETSPRQALIEKGGLRAACTYANFISLPQYKANLHCHTTHSDGNKKSEDMARWYEDHGYRILAMTDHDAYGDQDGGVSFPRLQNDKTVHDWDGDGVLHEKRTPKSCIEAYVRDYDKPAPSWVSENWKLNRPGEFVVLNGVEISIGRPHTNAIEPPTGKIPLQGSAFINWCHSNRGLLFLNHSGYLNPRPDRVFTDPKFYMSQLDGLEVMNGCLARDNRKGNNPDGSLGFAEPLWNVCLDTGKLYLGFANDDTHGFDAQFAEGGTQYFSGAGSAWNVIWCRELTKESVMESLRAGAFYASCGVEIDRVEITAESLTVHSPNATHIKVVGGGGRIRAQTDGAELTYRLAGDEKWIRVELWNDTICHPNEDVKYPQKAWMQPIMLCDKPTGFNK